MYEMVVRRLKTFSCRGRNSCVLLQHDDDGTGHREYFDILRFRRKYEKCENDGIERSERESEFYGRDDTIKGAVLCYNGSIIL